MVSTAFPNDLGEGEVHLIEEGCFASVGKTEDENVKGFIAFEDFAPHR